MRDNRTTLEMPLRALARLRDVRWATWFLIIGTTCGVYFAVSKPTASGVDEINHLARIDTISHGSLIPPPSDSNPPDYRISTDLCLFVYEDSPLANVCTPVAPARSGSFGTVNTAESYPPVSYATALPGYQFGRLVGDLDTRVRAARLTQLAAYLAVVTAALKLAPRGQPLLFLVALLPSAIQNAATISADPSTLSLSLLAVALTLRAGLHGAAGRLAPPRLLVALGTCLLVINAGKPGYAALALLAFVPPTAAFGSLRRRLLYGAVVTGLCAAVTLGWYVAAISGLTEPVRVNTDPTAQAERVSSDPMAFAGVIARTWTDPDTLEHILAGVVAPISRFKPPPPLFITIAGLTLITVAAFTPRLTRRAAEAYRREMSLGTDLLLAASLVVTAGCTFLAVNYALYVGNSPVGSDLIVGLQGRYFMPLLPLLLLVRLRPHRVADGQPPAFWPLSIPPFLLWWVVTST